MLYVLWVNRCKNEYIWQSTYILLYKYIVCFFHISVSFFLTKLTPKLVLKNKSFCKLNQILCMKITYPKMNHNALVTSNVKYFLLENLSDKKQNVCSMLVSNQGVHLSNRLEYVGVAVLAIAPSILVFENPVPLMFLW